MKTIRISKEVYEEIEKQGKFGETPNDVLERVFKIEKKTFNRSCNRSSTFPPNGTECRLRWRGKYAYGKIENGKLIVPGKGIYSSFSKPASELRNTSSNGWLYWEIKVPNANGNWILANNWRCAQNSKETRKHSAVNVKLPWHEATLNAIRRYCIKYHTNIIKFQELVRNELENIVKDTKTQGKTPKCTLQYYLQKLRDEDKIEFIDNQGTYRLK